MGYLFHDQCVSPEGCSSRLQIFALINRLRDTPSPTDSGRIILLRAARFAGLGALFCSLKSAAGQVRLTKP
jgi:hypothetical protein